MKGIGAIAGGSRQTPRPWDTHAVSSHFELGPRLRALALRVLPGRPAADLCCDHARLAASLIRSGRVPRVIAGDINAAPLAAARRWLAEQGLDAGQVELRQGDGLRVLTPADEVASVVIAGIGAPLCERLLEEGQTQLERVERLIVQANHGFPKLGSLRAHIVGLGFGLVDECISRERNRLYVTMVAERGGAGLADLVDRELGPLLREGRDPLWGAWLERERARIERALAGMQRARRLDAQLEDYRALLASVIALRG